MFLLFFAAAIPGRVVDTTGAPAARKHRAARNPALIQSASAVLRASPSYRLHREPALGAEAYREASVAPAFIFLPATGATALCRPRIPDGARYLKYGLFVQSVWEPERARRVRFSGALRFEGAS